MNRHRRGLLVALLCVMAWPGSASTPAFAADAAGNFAVKGVGAAPCALYLKAQKEKGQRYFMFAGWMDGTISTLNIFEKDTFDLAPWQSTDLLAAAVGQACSRTPDQSFQSAVMQVVRSLGRNRLQARSDQLLVGSAPNQTRIYVATLKTAQTQLKAQGYLKGVADGRMGASTTAALRAYQKAKGIKVTGLPDQPTLYSLLELDAAKR